MAYDESLADRVRKALARRTDVQERAMFGGLAFMVRGHMCCGLVRDKLMVRVDPDACDPLLDEPGVEPMDFTGRPMRGFLYVTADGISTAAALRKWVARALAFVDSRPRKAIRKTGAKPARQRHRAATTPRGGARGARKRSSRAGG